MGILKNFFSKISKSNFKIDETFFEDLEEKLIEADTGVTTAQLILDQIRQIEKQSKLNSLEDLKNELHNYISTLIIEEPLIDKPGLKIILFTGSNGAGKTTSLAKLSYSLKNKGARIKIVAGDTFRAAAIDQLAIWAERLDLPIIKTEHGADSGAIVYDGITSALSDQTDYLIIDTAGRMHTSDDLMRELQKIKEICLKRVDEEMIENILVVDATTGQNSFVQAETFHKFIPVTSLFLSKYDSIFKGGSVIRISSELKIPIKFIGTGESLEDFNSFQKEEFIHSLGL
jgi:fused signal recognition particle receptor